VAGSNSYNVRDASNTTQYRLGEALIEAALKLNPERAVVFGGAAVNEHVPKGVLENSEGLRF